ncbi:hypothetical protein [Kibdelosporangium aridum]|uniref:hypothetical protein n=1 Tax=Kibdelosporangium aridum TaxID=2030 RepID=UPI0035E86602
MSDEKPSSTKEKPDKPESPPPPVAPEPPQAPLTTADGPAPSREEAIRDLRGGVSESGSRVRSRKIAAEGIDRMGGVVNVFQGKFVVEGDFHSGGGKPAARRAGKGTAMDLAEVDYFVAAAGFDSGVDTVDTQNLAVIARQAGTGRRCQALATLVEVLRRNKIEPVVHELDVNVLGTMSWRVPGPRLGLIVVDRSGRAESLDDAWFRYASSQLRTHGSFLVVVTGPVRGSLATATKREDFVVADMDQPDPIEIVRSRLSGQLPWLPADELEDLLSKPELAALLEERSGPAFATRTANALLKALRENADLDEAIAQLRDPEDQVREWLGTDPKPEQVALVLATAVLEEATYLNVADAAVALYRDLTSGSGAMTPRYLRQLLSEHSWLEYVPQQDEPPILRFRDAKLRPAVLALIWFELDGAREKILAWLTKLASHDDVEVCARAAVAAGILSTSDFEHSLHRYILPWASSRVSVLREGAALALNVAAGASNLEDAVWTYVEQWAEVVRYDSKVRNLPATAGLAVGGELGISRPKRTLRVLRTLVCEGNWGLLGPAAQSTHLLLEAGLVAEVLDALMEWTEPDSMDSASEPMVKALTMFAYAAQAGEGKPVLLASATQHPQTLPELWGRALECEPVRVLAMDALRTWVDVAERDPSVRVVVLDMLAGIADRGDTDYGRLCHALRGWAEDLDNPSAMAADFYNELVEAGELTA